MGSPKEIIDAVITGWKFFIGKNENVKIGIINGTERKWSLWVGDRCSCDSDDMRPLDSFSTYYHTFREFNTSCHWARIYSEDEPEKYSGWEIFNNGAPCENNLYVIREDGIKRIVPETAVEEKVKDVSPFTDVDETGMREIKWLKDGCPKEKQLLKPWTWFS